MKLDSDITISQVFPSSGGLSLSQDLVVGTAKIRNERLKSHVRAFKCKNCVLQKLRLTTHRYIIILVI